MVHENRGLNPHIEDVTRRFALENFVAFAPDALFPLGGYPGNEDKARELFGTLDQAKTREDMIAAYGWLKARPECTGRVGAVGFCYGGGIVNMLATRLPDLAAGVAFYGSAPDVADVPKIKAPLMIQSASVDERINAAWPAFEEALKKANVRYERHSTRTRSTGSTTTPRRDTTRPRRSSRGNGRWISSTSTCGGRQRRSAAGGGRRATGSGLQAPGSRLQAPGSRRSLAQRFIGASISAPVHRRDPPLDLGA